MKTPYPIPPPPRGDASDGRQRGLSRRDFLSAQLAAAAGLIMGAVGLWPSRLQAGLPDVALAKGDVVGATRGAVGLLGGMPAFVKPGDKVVIKPNMSFAHQPNTPTNTRPEVVRELVAMCKEAGAGRIRVLDHPLRREELCIEGIKQACDVIDENIVHALSRDRFFKPADIPAGVSMIRTDVLRDVLEADVLIAAPVAKSHSSAGVSLSMKGMMGLIYDRGVMHWRHDLSTAIVDLATLLKPALVVIDATYALTTNGPGGPGKVVRYDTVIASRDMVAADAQAVRLVEWYGQKMAPRQVKHIRLAHERGLGRMDLDNLNIQRISV